MFFYELRLSKAHIANVGVKTAKHAIHSDRWLGIITEWVPRNGQGTNMKKNNILRALATLLKA